ncbi:response regulator [Caproicibacter sp. BJN0012]|uniref:response regulator n=1 Tax=Caproicibacter sp. BJN0012 TaxID=3110227 RepID=UPI002E0F581E|nr:response regulator [Caproicibacter sp. BJN0012]
MIKTIVVDDEWYNLEEICDLVEQTGFMSVEGRYQNGADALEGAARVMPQTAFIDIEMPEMDGLTLAEKLLEQDPEMKIVFITGWNQYAVAAFDLNALDYIMKPVNKARFAKMAQRLKQELGVRQSVKSDPPPLSIRCFGRFETFMDGRPVVWKRSKSEELFAYLLTNHDSFVHKEEILETLWQGCDCQKSLPILQTSACKIRNVLSPCGERVKLAYADNRYGLFLTAVSCDYLDVEKAVREFREDRPETYGTIEAACEVFQEGLFPYHGYLWSEAVAEGIRRRLAGALRKTARRRPAGSEEQCRALGMLARISPLEDDDQIAYLRVLQKLGKSDEAVRHGTWLKETLQRDYDAALTEKITKLLL